MSLFDFGSGIAGAVKALTAILQVLVPFDPPLVPLPPPTGGTVFAPTQAKAAEAGAYSWTTRDAGPGKFADYYPPKPDGDWLTPDGGVLYATTHFDGATAQAAQETDLAAETFADNQAAVERLNGYALRLAVPDESISGDIKLGTTVAMEAATATLKNTNLVTQVVQAQADARLREEHARRMAQAYALEFLPDAYRSGTITFSLGGPGS